MTKAVGAFAFVLTVIGVLAAVAITTHADGVLPQEACQELAQAVLGHGEVRMGRPQVESSMHRHIFKGVSGKVRTDLTIIHCDIADGSEGFKNGTQAEIYLDDDDVIAARLASAQRPGLAAWYKDGRWIRGTELRETLILNTEKQPAGIHLLLKSGIVDVFERDFICPDSRCALQPGS